VLELPWHLEKRAAPSGVMRVAAPLIAAAAMLATGFVMFALLGKEPVNALNVFFVQPLNSLYGWGELLLKATPLALCALGLALGFSANVWNIGAAASPCSGVPSSATWRCPSS
jgi:simple sugar transport system permease protein